MVHKLALGIGALVAVGVLIGSLGISGLAAHPARAETAAVPTATSDTTPLVKTQVDTVYVKPVPKAKVVHVTRTSPAPTRPPRVVTVTVHKPGNGGGDDNERDGGD